MASANLSTSFGEASDPRPMEEALQAASDADRDNLRQHRAQEDLLRRMNEALKASATAEPSPLASAPTQPHPVPVDNEPLTDVNPIPLTASIDPDRTSPIPLSTQAPISLTTPAPAPAPKPLILGPSAAADQSDGDLWSIVQPTAPMAAAPAGVASFEEALRRVDSSLEALVGASPTVDDAPLIEATVEAVVEESPAEVIEATVDEPSDPAEAARLRRQRLLKRAMDSLGGGPSRRDAPTQSESPAAAPVTVTTPMGAAAAPTPSSLDLQFAAQLDQRLGELQKGKDLYAILGVPAGGGKDQIKSAFLNLAKVFHPDRLPASLPTYQAKITTVFESIREAYETLYDDAKRAAYMSQKLTGAGAAGAAAPAKNAQQADDLLRMGEVFFKKRDYRSAEQHFARAHAMDKGAVSLAAQGWAIYMDPTRRAEAATSKQLMEQALKLDRNCDRAHYQLGVIARVEGDMTKAENHFREAVRVNPRHLEANQELRLIEMRKRKDGGKKGGGFFG